MSYFKILHTLKIGPLVGATGNTRHFRDGQLLPLPAQLQIVKIPDSQGYYLLYLDKDGEEMTDTFHESVEDAMRQAEWEFNVKKEAWGEEG